MGSDRARRGRGAAVRIGVGVALVAGSVALVSPWTATAATYTVTTAADVTDAGDGVLSLREAVAAANGDPGDDTIVLAAATAYTLTDCTAGALVHAEASVLTVLGNGASLQQTCDATQLWRSTAGASRLELASIHLVGGPNTTDTAVNGLAVEAAPVGRLGFTDVEISGFDAPGGSLIETGAGHSTTPYFLRIENSDIHDNTGTAIAGDNTSTRIFASSIRDNTGSALAIADGWPMVIDQSEIVDNGGSGISSSGQGFVVNALDVTNSTISGNGRVGVRCSQCGTVSITDSTIADNGLTAAGDRRGGVSVVLGRPASGQATLTISGTTITGNATSLATAGGGLDVTAAPLADPTASYPATAIVGGTISANASPGDGGGVRVTAGPLVVNGTTIADNTATGDGGGLRYGSPDGPFDLAITNATISGNGAGGDGGGLAVDNTLEFSITGSTVSDNTATGNGGGVWSAAGALSLVGSRVSGNAAAAGGGLYQNGEGLLLRASTVDANTAATDGGGVYASIVGNVLVENSTLSGNTATGAGGGYAHDGGAVIFDHVTAVGNSAGSGGDLWQSAAAPLTVTRSAFVSAAPCQLAAAATTGWSVFADGSCGAGPTDVVTATPLFGSLADNGGATPTHLPLDGSPALGRVPLASCSLAVDQRGTARPLGLGCESGSVEVVDAAPPITGSDGADLLIGTGNADVIRALGGKDVVRAGGGDDDVDGGDGPDILFGEGGDDLLVGGDGPDVLDGGPGADMLIGGNGPDVLYVGPGDTAEGGRGKDACWFPGATRPVDC